MVSDAGAEFKDSKERRLKIPFRGDLVEVAVQYLYYKQRYDHEPDKRPEFEFDFHISLELLLLSHYLGI